MPFWGWVLLVAGLSALAVGSIFAVVRTTHRLSETKRLHSDVDDIVDPVPMHVAAADSMTERELEAERARERGVAVSRDR